VSNVTAYFNGVKLANIVNITDMGASVNVENVFFVKKIGCLVKPSGYPAKTMTLSCVQILPKGIKRSAIETLMNDFNESIAGVTADITMAGNTFINCTPVGVSYNVFGENLLFDVSFVLGEQSYNQLSVTEVCEIKGGRIGSFKPDSMGSTFNFYSNCDMVRNVQFESIAKISEETNDYKYEQTGGVETIVVECWANTTSGENLHDLLAYMYNIMNCPIGLVGTFTLGGKSIENCIINSATMNEVLIAGLRYTVVLTASLQC